MCGHCADTSSCQKCSCRCSWRSTRVAVASVAAWALVMCLCKDLCCSTSDRMMPFGHDRRWRYILCNTRAQCGCRSFQKNRSGFRPYSMSQLGPSTGTGMAVVALEGMEAKCHLEGWARMEVDTGVRHPSAPMRARALLHALTEVLETVRQCGNHAVRA